MYVANSNNQQNPAILAFFQIHYLRILEKVATLIVTERAASLVSAGSPTPGYPSGPKTDIASNRAFEQYGCEMTYDRLSVRWGVQRSRHVSVQYHVIGIRPHSVTFGTIFNTVPNFQFRPHIRHTWNTWFPLLNMC